MLLSWFDVTSSLVETRAFGEHDAAGRTGIARPP